MKHQAGTLIKKAPPTSARRPFWAGKGCGHTFPATKSIPETMLQFVCSIWCAWFAFMLWGALGAFRDVLIHFKKGLLGDHCQPLWHQDDMIEGEMFKHLTVKEEDKEADEEALPQHMATPLHRWGEKWLQPVNWSVINDVNHFECTVVLDHKAAYSTHSVTMTYGLLTQQTVRLTELTVFLS